MHSFSDKFLFCNNNFQTLLSETPRIILSRIKETPKQSQNPQVLAIFRKTETRSSIDSPISCARLLKTYLSYVTITSSIM